MDSKITQLEEKLNYKFNNRGFLQEALTHSSYSYEHKMKCSNERFELLGDSVIHLAITEFLIQKLPDADEGTLSAIRSYCESETSLYERALEIDLGSYLHLGKGEEMTGGQYKESLLADAYEAIIAAVHQDGGYSKASKIVLEKFSKHIIDAYENKLYADSKSELQKLTQKHFSVLPTYLLLGESGADHDKTFHVEVKVSAGDELFVAEGVGKNKKAAEKIAASKLLAILVQREKK